MSNERPLSSVWCTTSAFSAQPGVITYVDPRPTIMSRRCAYCGTSASWHLDTLPPKRCMQCGAPG